MHPIRTHLRARAIHQLNDLLEGRVRGLTDDGAQISAVVLDLEGVDFVDSQGAAKLSEIHELVSGNGVSLRLARIKPPVRNVLEADGIVELIGSDHIQGNVNRSLEAELARREAL